MDKSFGKQQTRGSEPLAVLVSDVHYSLSTLELADAAFMAAVKTAIKLKVPLIDCGDITNDKAIIRGEVMNRLVRTFDYATEMGVTIYCIVGNHSLLSEKDSAHGLEFLRPYAHIVDFVNETIPGLTLVSYFSEMPKIDNGIVITHKGLKGANMGHYAQDRTSLPPESFKGLRVISGHYHAAQDISLPDNGLWSYVGNPYTLSFGEAMDPPKGYAILYSDGSLERVPLNLRKHVIIDLDLKSYDLTNRSINKDDLVLVRLRGPESGLKKITRASVAKDLQLPSLNFRLELIPDKAEKVLAQPKNTPDNELMDTVIENMEETVEQKAALKGLWRALVS